MEGNFVYLVASLLALLCGTVASDVVVTPEADGEMVLKLQHSFDMGQTWLERGLVNIHSTRTGAATIEQATLQDSQKSLLGEMCEGGSLYLVRLSGQHSNSDVGIHRTFASPCKMLDSNLQDLLTISLDWRGKLTAVSLGIQPTMSGNRPTKEGGIKLDTNTNNLNFKTKVATQVMENGPVPDTAAFITRMDEDKRKQEKGEVKDNRSFLAKYWMYIVPVVLLMAVNGASAPEGGGGGR